MKPYFDCCLTLSDQCIAGNNCISKKVGTLFQSSFSSDFTQFQTVLQWQVPQEETGTFFQLVLSA